jgi:phosphatidylserine decarboxylase
MKRTFGITIHKEGRKILFWLFIILFAITLLAWVLGGHLLFLITLAVSVFLYIFITNFFRSPKRISQPDPRDIMAPADGKVVVIENIFEEWVLKENRVQISIFMSILNVHANWFPIEGKVIHYSHQKGNNLAAWLPKASSENERSTVLIRSSYNGKTVLIRQIAGAIARRIVTYAYTGKKAHFNEHLGFIKLGSRVDIFLPAESVDILVKQGDKTTGNKTVIARWK